MNPLDEKLDQAIQDYRDKTAPAMDVTRRHVLAQMRRERLQRWTLGGGSVALLSLVLYFVLGRTEPPVEPLPTAAKTVDAGGVIPADPVRKDVVKAMQAQPAVQPKPIERADEMEPPQAPKRGTSNSALTYAITRDAFIDESTELTSRATNAVMSENLALAAESYRDLARLCERRMKWKRAVAAYDSAVSYATRIGDTHLLQALTRDKALATKKVVKPR